VYKFHLFLILFFVGFFFLFGASLTVSRAPPPDLPYAPTHIPSLSLSYDMCVCVLFCFLLSHAHHHPHHHQHQSLCFFFFFLFTIVSR